MKQDLPEKGRCRRSWNASPMRGPRPTAPPDPGPSGPARRPRRPAEPPEPAGATGPTGPVRPTAHRTQCPPPTNAYVRPAQGAAFTVCMSEPRALPNAQTLSPRKNTPPRGFKRGTNDTFTVAEARTGIGFPYNIKLVTPLTLGRPADVRRTEIEASNVMPQTAPLSRLSNDFLVDLPAGAKVSLQVRLRGPGDPAAQLLIGALPCPWSA